MIRDKGAVCRPAGGGPEQLRNCTSRAAGPPISKDKPDREKTKLPLQNVNLIPFKLQQMLHAPTDKK